MAQLMRRVAMGVALVVVLAACSGNGDPTSASGATLPLPSSPDTLLPPPNDTQPPDVTDALPPDAMFGGDVCSALEQSDFSGLGRLGEVGALSADSCEYPVGDSSVVVQLATPAEFAQPGSGGEEIAPVDDVGLGAIGVDRGDRYEVYVQTENGYFSVTADSRDVAVQLARAAAARTRPTDTTEPSDTTDPEDTGEPPETTT